MFDKNKISNNSVNWLLFFNVVLYVVITEVVIFINSYFTFEQPDAYTTRIVVQLFAVLLPVVLFTRSKQIDIMTFFRINPISSKNCFMLVGLGICSQFIGIFLKMIIRLIFTMFKIPYAVSGRQMTIPENGFEIFLAIIALMILPVIAEEFLFRGLVLGSYERWGTRSAIIISSILFGILHLDIATLPATIFMGFMLAYVVVKTDSLIAGIILHFVNNSVAFLLALFPVSTFLLIVMFLCSIILFIYILISFNKINIQSKNIPQKRPVSSEIVRIVFTLPILLSIIAFVIIQLYIFEIF